MIKLYNTLSRKKEEFKPIKKGSAGIYSCGPTVYNFAHIGNLRSFIFADILQRVLRFNGLKVNWVMNITDVDDKTIRDSQKEYPDLESKEALKQLTTKYEKAFWQDLAELNIERPDKIPHATEFISQMQDLIRRIIKSGYAYECDGSFYFDVAKYAKNFKYGQLVDLDLSQLKTTERIMADEYEKAQIQDFALWKATKSNEPSWDFKFLGKNYPGRPGWHIECSVMSQEYLGIPFDIHTGGVDLRFPHHENEIAQNTTGYGTKKLANFFIHNEHVLVDNQKMAKRFKNFYTLKNLEEKGFESLAFRYLCLLTHYQKKLNFSWEALKGAQQGLNHLWFNISKLKIGHGKVIKKYLEKFNQTLNDNLDLPKTLGLIHKVIKSQAKEADKRATLLKFDEVLGLNLNVKNIDQIIGKEIKTKIKKYELARKKKDYQLSDKLRQEINKELVKFNLQISDTKEGAEIVKK
jgi:cysteinyl-tRNA synthetase